MIKKDVCCVILGFCVYNPFLSYVQNKRGNEKFTGLAFILSFLTFSMPKKANA